MHSFLVYAEVSGEFRPDLRAWGLQTVRQVLCLARWSRQAIAEPEHGPDTGQLGSQAVK